MRQLVLVLLATGALAQAPETGQKLREAQQASGAGDCVRTQAALAEALAADPRNYVAHVLSAHCLLREKEYGAAAAAFRRALEVKPDAQAAVLGLIQAYALSGDSARRDAEIDHLRSLVERGRLPRTVRFVREQFTSGDYTVVVSEDPYLTLLRSRYAFDVFDPHGKLVRHFELVSREIDQAAFRSRNPRAPAGARRFSLISAGANESTLRLYDRGEPALEQVLADVKAVLAGRTPPAAAEYARAKTPADVDPVPITVDDPNDPRLRLQAGQVVIEFIAHSCFRIHTPDARVLIDPFASRMWLGYDFPAGLAADAVLITHPHYDHDADVLLGQKPPPWAPDVRVLRDPGSYTLPGLTIRGLAGRHAEPWGEEFGRTNTIWLIEAGGVRIAHLGDNGPLSEEIVRQLGRVDVVMIPVDARHHILEDAEVEAIRKALNPRVVIPMHYRHPDLEPSAESPEGLGEIGPWLAGQENVVKLQSNVATFTAATLLPSQLVLVFPHSPKVGAPRE